MFNQTFEFHDLLIIAFLVVLEGVLSIDNALVLGLLARRLPKSQQQRALTYGLVGAFVFRFVAIAMASLLIRWWFFKLLGGLYLIYISLKYFIIEAWDETQEKIVEGPNYEPELVDAVTGERLDEDQVDEELAARVPLPIPARCEDGTEMEMPAAIGVSTAVAEESHRGTARFWPTVLVIELTDIAFAIDSILAAIALVGSASSGTTGLHPKFWVIVTGGMIGVALMRVAAVMFIRLLEKFPRLEISAYLLVLVIGGKLCVDWCFNRPGEHPHVDFHHPGSPAFLIFWTIMIVCFLIGFIPKRSAPQATAPPQ
jgi:predicted tellurium resistance membrane protein TerC